MNDGIALYEADERELHKPKPKSPIQALAAAKEYFEDDFPAAMRRYKLSQDGIAQGFQKEAAFDLQQTAERLYNCLLLTLTYYTPYNHNLAFLRTQAERLDHSLFEIWPRGTRKERAMFEKLKEAYVKARYSKHYRIDEDELAWLSERIEALGAAVHDICTARIAELEKSVEG